MFNYRDEAATSERKRGYKGEVMRKRRRKLYPLCAHCAERGRITKTQVIDHIKPLHHGGLDVDSNCQGLCEECHAIKTKHERSHNPCRGYDDNGKPLEKSHPWNTGANG